MKLFDIIWLLPYAVAASASHQRPLIEGDTTKSKRLQISAVVNENDFPYNANLECWELDTPFQDYPTIGTSISLANVSNLTYVTLPPKSAEGLHHPPHPMFFVLLAGAAHVEIPGKSEDLWIVEGVNPLITATDTLGVGHNTSYPGNKTTIALQAPFRNGIIPEHTVVAQGACPISERF